MKRTQQMPCGSVPGSYPVPGSVLGTPTRRRRHASAAAGAVLLAMLSAACTGPGTGTRPRPPASVPAATTGVPGSDAPARSTRTDPARFATPVRRYAGQARIDPRLLMAILFNESYKPHDPALERAWQKIDPDAGFGIATMHRSAFDDTRRGRDFANRAWQDLPDDPNLAIEAAAWYLHDLAAQLPARWAARYTKDELLALGYNAGPGNMKAFAQGRRPGTTAQSYLDNLHANWDAAAQALR